MEMLDSGETGFGHLDGRIERIEIQGNALYYHVAGASELDERETKLYHTPQRVTSRTP
jgi:hypothetical protein